MIDPVTAAAGAAKAYAMVKGMVEAGRSVEDTISQIGVWWGHASDVAYADRKKPSLFRKMVFSQSVEQEALQRFARSKALQAQQRDMIMIIRYAYGDAGFQEFRDIKAKVSKERQDAIYAQQEMKEYILSGLVVIVGLIIFGSIIAFIVGGTR
jgi:hypothetical protein